jgi:chromosomal replication initiation ATPase DnaA
VTSLINTVATEVAREFGSRPSSILAPTRGRAEDARARAIAMYVYQRAEPVCAPCLTAVGRAFSRDRTTVRHALQRVDGWRALEPGFADTLGRVQQRVAAKGYPGGVQ